MKLVYTKMKSINDIKKFLGSKETKFSERDHYVNKVANMATKQYAIKHGLFHSVDNPDGLTELTPHLRNPTFATTEYEYKILGDGKVHKIMHGQYEYLNGPADMGIVTHDEWCELSNKMLIDIEIIIRELLTGEKSPFKKDIKLAKEINDIAISLTF